MQELVFVNVHNLKTTDLITDSKITPIIQKYAPRIEAYFRNLIEAQISSKLT